MIFRMDFSFVTVAKKLSLIFYRGVQNIKFPREKMIRILPVKKKDIHRVFRMEFVHLSRWKKTSKITQILPEEKEEIHRDKVI